MKFEILERGWGSLDKHQWRHNCCGPFLPNCLKIVCLVCVWLLLIERLCFVEALGPIAGRKSRLPRWFAPCGYSSKKHVFKGIRKRRWRIEQSGKEKLRTVGKREAKTREPLFAFARALTAFDFRAPTRYLVLETPRRIVHQDALFPTSSHVFFRAGLLPIPQSMLCSPSCLVRGKSKPLVAFARQSWTCTRAAWRTRRGWGKRTSPSPWETALRPWRVSPAGSTCLSGGGMESPL